MAAPQLVVALGDRRYRVFRRWGELPDGISLGHVSKVAADSHGNVYVSQRIDPQVVVFSPDGKYLRSWGSGVLADPHGIFVTADDRVLVVDRGGHQVLGFDAEGELLFTLGERERPRLQAPFNHPTDVAVAPNGDMYVSDGYGNSAVHRFSADGELVRTWGKPGNGPAEFTTPHGIWVLSDGRVLVGDRENSRIQIFDAEGDYLSEWDDVYKPMDIFADPDDAVYVSDQTPRVTKFSSDGEVVGRCMAAPEEGHGIRSDPAGNIFVVDTATDYLIKLEHIVEAS